MKGIVYLSEPNKMGSFYFEMLYFHLFLML